MKRNDFFKTCAAAACGCCTFGFLAPPSVHSEEHGEETPTAQDDDLLKRQLDFARERFAELMSIMGAHIDSATHDTILKELGRECAQGYNPLFQRYSNDLQGYLAAIQTRWVERTEYDEATDTLRVIGKVRPCVCPLVKMGRTPVDFCSCTMGWNQYAFSTVLGRPVTVELEESVLRGSSRCTWRVIGIRG